jgi:hypothetical protein
VTGWQHPGAETRQEAPRALPPLQCHDSMQEQCGR